MNFFVFWKNKDGEDELITPALDGTILPGVTRDSIINLCQELKEFKVNIRPIKI
jgi:branched-chain amino acid aminotransferase